MRTQETKLDAIGPRLGKDLSMGKCTTEYTEGVADRTPQRTANGGAGDVTTITTTGGMMEKSRTPKSSRRAHFVTSHVPLVEGGEYLALCGNVIPKTVFLYQVDVGSNQPMPTMAVCGRCTAAIMLARFAEAVRYVYAVVEARDMS